MGQPVVSSIIFIKFNDEPNQEKVVFSHRLCYKHNNK